jgi:DNA (cytosine-5)-methyltransferase 1
VEVKYLSVCSGIEAATVAWHHMGWEPVGFSEIEPFPIKVLKHHYPHVKQLGSMTDYENWDIEHPNLLVGGTP